MTEILITDVSIGVGGLLMGIYFLTIEAPQPDKTKAVATVTMATAGLQAIFTFGGGTSFLPLTIIWILTFIYARGVFR